MDIPCETSVTVTIEEGGGEIQTSDLTHAIKVIYYFEQILYQ